MQSSQTHNLKRARQKYPCEIHKVLKVGCAFCKQITDTITHYKQQKLHYQQLLNNSKKQYNEDSLYLSQNNTLFDKLAKLFYENKIPMDTYRKDSTIGKTQKQLMKSKDNIIKFLKKNKIDAAFIHIFDQIT